MKLHGSALFGSDGPTFLARIENEAESGVFPLSDLSTGRTQWRLHKEGGIAGPNVVCVGSDHTYLSPGDILRLSPSHQALHVLYRRLSPSNAIFLTEQCNSRCLMCSQPPREANDAYLVDEALMMIPWMDPQTREIGITGGEPTSHGEGLIAVLKALHAHLPSTSVHLLTNGRRLAHLPYAKRIADIGLPDLMVGIPLHADVPNLHDFIAQAPHAFEQTVFGLTNLGRLGIPIELRIVVHRYSASRLESLARFIARNLPFVSQVAFMGLEQVGFARANMAALWMDPSEYMPRMAQAMRILAEAEICARIFNLPLCIIPSSLRERAAQSISDWKTKFLPACEPCNLKSSCCGFFETYGTRQFNGITPQ